MMPPFSHKWAVTISHYAENPVYDRVDFPYISPYNRLYNKIFIWGAYTDRLRGNAVTFRTMNLIRIMPA